RQRRVERGAELALGVVEAVLFEQRAREHDARLLARRQSREYFARERLGLRRLLRELNPRLLDCLDSAGPEWHNVVRVVRLRVEFFGVNLDAHYLRCGLELRLAEVLRRDVRRRRHALAAVG